MTNGSVTVFLRGGLGNQLFQYGAGMALAKSRGFDLNINTSALPMHHEVISGVSHWPEQISLFRHDGSISDSLFGLSRPIASRLLQYQRLLLEKKVFTAGASNIYANESGTYHSRFEHLVGERLYVNSYCNDKRFFLDYTEDLVRQISSPANPSDSYHEASELALQAQPVGIHVRLGDYRNLEHVYGPLDPGYFERALKMAFRLVGDRPIWLFSDEPEIAQELIPSIASRVATPPIVSTLRGYETLLLMSKMKAFVGSNSSFSWWAAFLARSQGFEAIFPRPTFAIGGPAEPKTALPEDWIQIGRKL